MRAAAHTFRERTRLGRPPRGRAAVERDTGARALLGVLALGLGSGAYADVVFDGTMGPQGSLSGNFAITNAHGTQVGANLFHSFETFNVNVGESATFTSDFAGVTAHVIGRVTGRALSTLDGALASTIPGADLWLINPAGVVVGASAVLDVPAGFHLSTADYLVLEDGGRFDATTPSASSLTIASPAAFGFVDADVAPITIGAASLSVMNGQPISLVGGAIDLTGTTLLAPSGDIAVASVAGAGVIDLADPAANRSGIAAFGDVVMDGASVATHGEEGGAIYILGGRLLAMGSSSIFSRTTGAGQGRDVRIDAGNVTLGGSTVVGTETQAGGHAGSIVITTDTLRTGSAAMQDGSQIISRAAQGSAGNAGGITIAATNVDHQFSTIGIFTLGTGIGGVLSIDASDTIHVEGGFGTTFANNSIATATAGDVVLRTGRLAFVGGSILARALGNGDGGNLLISADTLTMERGAQFSVGAFGLGRGGTIDLDVEESIMLSDDVGYPTGVFAGAAAGQGGDIVVRTGVLEIFAGAQFSDSVFAAGSAGNIDVEASDRILISGAEDLFTGIFANTFASGDGGTLRVTTPLLELLDGGSLQASSLPVQGGGEGGSIVVNVDNLVIDGVGSFISARSFGTGSAGDIAIDAANGITLMGRPGEQFTGIFASADSSGHGGNIAIETGSLTIGDAALIRALTFGAGNAGRVTINASGDIRVDAASDPISGISNSTLGRGNAGPIDISARSLTVSGVGSIEAASFILGAGDPAALGDASDISIEVVDLAVLDGGGIRVATFGAGAAGRLNVDASGRARIAGVAQHGPATLSSETRGTGAGGAIALAASDVVVENGGLVTAETRGAGIGGDIGVAGQRIRIATGGSVTAAGSGSGNAGTVRLTAGQSLAVESGGAIETDSAASAGGNIDIRAGNMLFLDDGRISAAAGGVTPADAGGNVTIDPDFVILRKSSILASANAGNGGNIGIRAGSFVLDANSTIDASSSTGLDGKIAIDSPDEITGSVLPLETPEADAAVLATQRCAPARAGERSTLVANVDALARPVPGDYLASPLDGADAPTEAEVAAADDDEAAALAALAAASPCSRAL